MNDRLSSYRISVTKNNSTAGRLIKTDIITKLNKLIEKQKSLREAYLKSRRQNQTEETSPKRLNHKELEEGKKSKSSFEEFLVNGNETLEKPFFGNYDLLGEDLDAKVTRKRRKNRQKETDYPGDDFETLPDQRHSETITKHTVHKNNNRHKFQSVAYKEPVKTDIRLEIPISLDATISLPKNKQSLEELLDFVMKHDSELLEEYLQERQPAGGVGGLYEPPITFLSPPSGLYEPPDVSHTGYAAVVSPAPHHGLPVQLQPAHQVLTSYPSITNLECKWDQFEPL